MRPLFILMVTLSLLVTADITFAVIGALPTVEGRGIWIDANSIPTDDQAMAAFVDSLAKANLNILFPETIRRGYTIYPSKLDEQDPKFKGYDPLTALIKEAHKKGMEVHPWVWVFRQGYSQDKGPIFKAHPDWMAVNKWGETLSANGGYWICPCIPEAKDYLLLLYKELAQKYEIDGIHLDYIRFENQFPAAYCYNSCCRDKFRSKFGVDPIDIDPLSESQIKWHLWREDLVNTLVQRVYNEIRTYKPSIKISAAVGSRPDTARADLLQNWPNWVDNKWVDFVTPMAYTANNETFRDMVTAEETAVGDKTIIMPGIGLHTHKTVDTTLSQIDLARCLDADGVTLFASVYLKDELRNALISGPFDAKARIPFRNPLENVGMLLNTAHSIYKTKPGVAADYLSDASRLLKYIAYRGSKTGYIEPTRPPILIPESVLPIPTVEVPKVTGTITVDGKLDEPTWSIATRIGIEHTELGNVAAQPTEVLLAYDDSNFYIGYMAQEPAIDRSKETVTKHDGPVFYDDSAEIFLDPWGKRHEYYQLAVNLLGAHFDAKVNNVSANPEWTSAISKESGCWSIEIAIPFASLGVAPPKPGDKWYANFARNRWVSGQVEYSVWSVPYGSFHRPERFGMLLFK